jgi:carboxymethylenebutenolidase
VPWLSHWAADDPYEDASEARALQERQAGETSGSAAHLYEDTHHWFAEPDRPEYDEAASEEAYRRTVEFLRTSLG